MNPATDTNTVASEVRAAPDEVAAGRAAAEIYLVGDAGISPIIVAELNDPGTAEDWPSTVATLRSEIAELRESLREQTLSLRALRETVASMGARIRLG